MRGYTLVEMMFVLLLVGILLGMIFRFGGQRLNILQSQLAKESLIDFVERVIIANRSSSLVQSYAYEYADIFRGSGVVPLSVRYYSSTGALVFVQTGSYYPYMTRSFVSVSTPSLILRIVPYQLGCSIYTADMTTQSQALVRLDDIRSAQSYCFAIYPQTCMIQQVPCA